MGFLWDLIQHSQIREQGDRTRSLESRVARLESELTQTRRVLCRPTRLRPCRGGRLWLSLQAKRRSRYVSAIL